MKQQDKTYRFKNALLRVNYNVRKENMPGVYVEILMGTVGVCYYWKRINQNAFSGNVPGFLIRGFKEKIREYETTNNISS